MKPVCIRFSLPDLKVRRLHVVVDIPCLRRAASRHTIDGDILKVRLDIERLESVGKLAVSLSRAALFLMKLNDELVLDVPLLLQNLFLVMAQPQKLRVDAIALVLSDCFKPIAEGHCVSKGIDKLLQVLIFLYRFMIAESWILLNGDSGVRQLPLMRVLIEYLSEMTSKFL